MPSISASMRSPGLAGGSLAPTSPVGITSPGLSVYHLDTSAMHSAMVKRMSLVLPACIATVSPFMRNDSFMFWGSATSSAGMTHGPVGALVSNSLPDPALICPRQVMSLKDRVAPDVVHCALDRDAVPLLAHDEGELGAVDDGAVMVGGDVDVVVVADREGGHLGEEDGVRDVVPPGQLNVALVHLSHADQLGRWDYRRPEPGVRQGHEQGLAGRTFRRAFGQHPRERLSGGRQGIVAAPQERAQVTGNHHVGQRTGARRALALGQVGLAARGEIVDPVVNYAAGPVPGSAGVNTQLYGLHLFLRSDGLCGHILTQPQRCGACRGQRMAPDKELPGALPAGDPGTSPKECFIVCHSASFPIWALDWMERDWGASDIQMDARKRLLRRFEQGSWAL